MKTFSKWFIIILFFVNAILYLFRSGAPLGGDEAAAYVSLMPFLHALMSGQILPTFLVFFHEPLFQIIQLPVVLFGASQFFVRLPNIFGGIILFVVLYKIGKVLFKKNYLLTIILLSLYSFSGYNLILRTGIHIAIFNLILALCLYSLLKFQQGKKRSDLYNSYKLLLLNFFVYIDAIFCAPGLIIGFLVSKLKFKDIFKKELVIPTLIAGSSFALWTLGVYLGSVVSGVYNWQLQAPFRLLARGSSYSVSAVIDNINLFKMGNSAEFVFFVFPFVFLSVFFKRARSVWGFLIGPFIFFNLVKSPTVHPLFFWVLILIACVLGVQFLTERIPSVKYLVVAFFALAIIKNALLITFSDPFSGDRAYKIAATFLRQNTSLCENIYLKSDLDGFVFRFYFDRGYVTELNDQISIAFVDGDSSFLRSAGFGKLAEIKIQNSAGFSIYKRGYDGNVSDLSYIDPTLFNFSNTLTYIGKCPLPRGYVFTVK